MRCQAARQMTDFMREKSLGWKNEENGYGEAKRGIVVSKTTAG